MNNPKKNFIYNIIYQILILIIPLITAPYLSRVIFSKGVGIYSYTYSIVNYFMLLTLLGVNNYGNRTIARVRDDKEKLSKTFWSIYSLQLIMGIIMIIIYIGYILLFDNKYKMIALIQSLFILSAMLDINWLFFGLEEFKKTITRNTFVKIVNVILIFLLVKSKNDVWKYTIIMSGMTCLSQLILWGFTKEKIKFVKIKWKDITKHIKPNLILFIPVIAVSLYKIMDKVMLGFFSGVTEVGLYESAEKIINIPLTIITSLGTVMLPRISNIISKGNEELVKKYISKSISFVSFLSFAMFLGLFAISEKFAPIYFGSSFQKSGTIIKLLSVTLPFIAFANVIRTQYLIPKEKDHIFIISVSLGALVNLVCNLIFIPLYDSYGACIGTIVAEVVVMMYQCISLRKSLPIKSYLHISFYYFFKAIIMFLLISIIDIFDFNEILKILLQVIIGVTIYFVLNYNYLSSIINLKKMFLKVFKNNVVINDIDNDGNDDINIIIREKK